MAGPAKSKAARPANDLTGGQATLATPLREWTHDRNGKPAFLRPLERARGRRRQGRQLWRRQAAQAGLRPHAVAFLHRLYDLWHAERRQEQRHPDLPCAHRRSIRGVGASRHRQARLVERDGGPGQPIDTDRFFVICANVIGGCMGTTGPAATDPATGKPFGLNFPLVTVPTWCGLRPCCWTRWGSRPFCAVIGGSMGGMQVLQWAASIPSACAPCAHRLRRAPFRPEHRLPRSRPPGDHGRSRLDRAAIISSTASGRRKAWRWRAWRRISPIFPKRRCSANSAAICRTATRCHSVRSGFPDRILSASSGHQLCRPLRRQFLSTSPGRWIISIWRKIMPAMLADAFRNSPNAFLHHLLHLRLAVSHRGEQAHRACAQCGGGEGELCRDQDRQGP